MRNLLRRSKILGMFCNLYTVMKNKKFDLDKMLVFAMFKIAFFRNLIHVNTSANQVELKASIFALWELIFARNLHLVEDYF